MESIEARNQKSFSVKEVHQSTQLEATTTGKIVVAVQAIIAVRHCTERNLCRAEQSARTTKKNCMATI
jgi:hypothetical protein